MHHLFKNVEAGVLHELYLNYKDPISDLDYMLPVPVLIENMGHTYDEVLLKLKICFIKLYKCELL